MCLGLPSVLVNQWHFTIFVSYIVIQNNWKGHSNKRQKYIYAFNINQCTNYFTKTVWIDLDNGLVICKYISCPLTRTQTHFLLLHFISESLIVLTFESIHSIKDWEPIKLICTQRMICFSNYHHYHERHSKICMYFVRRTWNDCQIFYIINRVCSIRKRTNMLWTKKKTGPIYTFSIKWTKKYIRTISIIFLWFLFRLVVNHFSQR